MNPSPDSENVIVQDINNAQNPILTPDPILIPTPNLNPISLPSQTQPSVNSAIQEVNTAFNDFLRGVEKKLVKRVQDEEKKCLSLHDNPENYAKCLYAFQKDLKDVTSTLNFKASWVRKNMENCMQKSLSKSNKEEAIKMCLGSGRDIINRVLDSF